MSQRTHMVDQDAEGLRIAFRELMEEGFLQAQLERKASGDPRYAAAEAKNREQQMKLARESRTLTAGYYTFAGHIFRLDAERNAGVQMDPHSLAHFESTALRTLVQARNEYRAKHPHCPACGVEQAAKFHQVCTECGYKFNRKAAK